LRSHVDIRGLAAPLLQNCYLQVRPMRRSDEAVRDGIEMVVSSFLARSKDSWTLAQDVAKRATECTEAVPTGLERHLGDAELSVAQQSLCPLDPLCKQIAVRRYSKRLSKRTGEMGFRNPAHPCQAADWPFLMRRCVHPILRAQQPANKLRPL
jgi:hypothetical protein